MLSYESNYSCLLPDPGLNGAEQGWWTWRVWRTQFHAECSATYVGETGRMLRVCIAEHRRTVKNKYTRMELPCMSKRLRIPSTGRKQSSLGGRTIGEKEGFWSPCDPTKETNDEPGCWSNLGSIADPIWLPRKQHSRDWTCYVRRSNPYLGRKSFHCSSTYWWRPQGRNKPTNAKLSLTDCVSKCSWIWKDYPKIICIGCIDIA